MAGLRALLRDDRGDSAVEFIVTAGLMIALFVTLVTAIIYVTQYYNASYICRRVVRSIEIAGEYNEAEVRDLADRLCGGSLEDLSIRVDATYITGHKIQLRDGFQVSLSASYKVGIMDLGDDPQTLDLPIQVSMNGMSEVFWK